MALVETVAHTESGLHFYHDADVIVDVGGQDIKLIILKNGRVKDFKLNTQCSAGNGYFLQSTAEGFGMPVEEYADIAFGAQAMPAFGYGCAVFMQSDIVDFQRQGWKPEEIMAGLAAVLPKNIWLYVSQIPNLAKLGTRFVLQGGTQHNLAAVKSQVDFIESRFKGNDVKPDVIVHEHCGESGEDYTLAGNRFEGRNMGRQRIEPVRVGVIGLGRFGRLHSLTAAGLAEARAGGGRGARRGRASSAPAKELPGVPGWTNLEQAMDESGPKPGSSPAPRRARAGDDESCSQPARRCCWKSRSPTIWRKPEPGSARPHRFQQPDDRAHRAVQQRVSAASRRSAPARADLVHRLRPPPAGQHRASSFPARIRCMRRWSTISTPCRSLLDRAEPVRSGANIHRTHAARSTWRWRSLQWNGGAVGVVRRLVSDAGRHAAARLRPDGGVRRRLVGAHRAEPAADRSVGRRKPRGRCRWRSAPTPPARAA